jgi:hypothetical protein
MYKRWKIAGVIVIAVALLLVGTLTVAAQGPLGGGMGRVGGMIDRLGAMARMGRGMGLSAANGEAIAEALGLTTDELRAQLRDGATLAALAEAKGVELQTLRDLAESGRKANILERLGQALENGKITDAFSTWFKKGVDAGYVLDFGGRKIETPYITAAAAALEMEPEDVELQMWGGRTLADLAKKAGVELTAVQAAIETAQKDAARARIQEAVKDGKLTQEQANWMIEGVDSGFQGMGGFGAKGFGRGAMPMMGGRGGGWGMMGGRGGMMGGRVAPGCPCSQGTTLPSGSSTTQ